MFVGSALAGQRAAMVMSLLQSAKLHGHDLWAYLRDALQRLPTQLNSRIEELLPHCWTPEPGLSANAPSRWADRTLTKFLHPCSTELTLRGCHCVSALPMWRHRLHAAAGVGVDQLGCSQLVQGVRALRSFRSFRSALAQPCRRRTTTSPTTQTENE